MIDSGLINSLKFRNFIKIITSVEITSQTYQLSWVVEVNHVISMLGAGASPAPPIYLR
jgi:hypothetical protein